MALGSGTCYSPLVTSSSESPKAEMQKPARRRYSVLHLWVTLMPFLLGSLPLMCQSRFSSETSQLSINADELVDFAKSFGSTGVSDDTLERVLKLSLPAPQTRPSELAAFEENRFFVYFLGNLDEIRADLAKERQIRAKRSRSRRVRRMIFLKPSTFIVDDTVIAASPGRVQWSLYSRAKPTLSGESSFRVIDEDHELVCETLLPHKVTRHVRRHLNGLGQPDGHVLELVAEPKPEELRIVNVLHVRLRGAPASGSVAEVDAQKDLLSLKVRTAPNSYHMTLPPAQAGAGDIEILRDDGKVLMGRRVFPSGRLPHGVKGARLLEQWDSDYRKSQPPLWDAGQASGELIKLVESGMIRPGRAVELGCGSGTDAIYLARLGFEVTAIDIAPTALRQAQEKALKAGVRVNWLLADVLAPPTLKPFDFIFDRGCYHEVRGHNLKGYIETVDRLSRSGTRFLLLAGNANETSIGYGPPQVTEAELREDFSPLFEFEWLRESRFEIARPSALGPLAWSALLMKKSKP